MLFEKETFFIEGPILIKPKVFSDSRGYFFESYSKKDLETAGIPDEFVQDNQAYSSKGILRGLHFQKSPHAQKKLVRVAQGAVFDVAVDIRSDSPTFGKYISVHLTDQNHHIFFIPEGFAHGYLVLSETSIFQYKCTNYYVPTSESGIKFDDPNVNIAWPDLGMEYTISSKDQILPQLLSFNAH